MDLCYIVLLPAWLLLGLFLYLDSRHWWKTLEKQEKRLADLEKEAYETNQGRSL